LERNGWWCSGEGTNDARFAEAGLLVGDERYAEALDMMDNFVEEHATTNNSLLWQEVKRMMDYIGILTEADEDERGAYQLD